LTDDLSANSALLSVAEATISRLKAEAVQLRADCAAAAQLAAQRAAAPAGAAAEPVEAPAAGAGDQSEEVARLLAALSAAEARSRADREARLRLERTVSAAFTVLDSSPHVVRGGPPPQGGALQLSQQQAAAAGSG